MSQLDDALEEIAYAMLTALAVEVTDVRITAIKNAFNAMYLRGYGQGMEDSLNQLRIDREEDLENIIVNRNLRS